MELSESEWQISAAQTDLHPGATTFVTHNTGVKAHQLLVVRSDLPPQLLPTVAGGAIEESKVNIVGRIDSLAPNETREITLKLSPGKYMLICNVVDHEPGAAALSHFDAGMVTTITALE